MIQYSLKRENSDTYRVCWLDKEVEPGIRLMLKDEEGWWVVQERYIEMDSNILDLNRNPRWKQV